jgi:hypothetical protein
MRDYSSDLDLDQWRMQGGLMCRTDSSSDLSATESKDRNTGLTWLEHLQDAQIHVLYSADAQKRSNIGHF